MTYVSLEVVNLGKGKRCLVPGGRLNSTCQIKLAAYLDEYMEYEPINFLTGQYQAGLSVIGSAFIVKKVRLCVLLLWPDSAAQAEAGFATTDLASNRCAVFYADTAIQSVGRPPFLGSHSNLGLAVLGLIRSAASLRVFRAHP